MQVMKIMRFRLMMMTILTSAAATAVSAGTVTVSLPDAGAAIAAARPGDEILISDGEWSDISLKWKAPGFPLCVRALNPGNVRISGNSSLRISGDSLTIGGLDFRHASIAKGGIIEFRNGRDVANACRLTNCVIDSCNPSSRVMAGNYIVMHGKGNRVDHCSLTGKFNLGVTLLVNLNDARSIANNHRIDHNYFGPRPVSGSNGAETMRIGTSQQAYETSGTIVENNLFERCNGEVEIISVKSSDNIVRDNTFFECEGVVALRHGKRNKVTGNHFYGNSRQNTGGVRVVDEGHEISGNTFDGLAGGRFFSALALMNSVPNSLPNRYVRVSNADIHHNTFYNCTNIEFGTGRDMERTEAPADCSFHDNAITPAKGCKPYVFIDPEAEVKISGIKKVKSPSVTDISSIRNGYGATRGNITAGIAAALVPDTIRLASGVLLRDETLSITRPTVILGSDSSEGTTLRWKGSKSGNFITICNGATLEVHNITFDFALQQGYTTVRNAIATETGMLTPYSLTVDGCRFINSPESGCCAIRGTKGTFADVFTVKNSMFADLSGNGISLADETDDKGVYSADHITISSCSFSHMLGIPVNIYRGGSDESTAGPYVSVLECKFDDCCNRERGSVLRLIGPQKLLVKDCLFDNSGRGGATIRLDETSWEDVKVKNCEWINSGRVISNRNVIE